MGQEQILKKLTSKLTTVPTSEADVVYILSRIRKILEQNNYPEKYCRLNFYCNLALHSKIDRPPKSIIDLLWGIKNGDPNNSIFEFTNQLHEQLHEFIKEFGLPDTIYKEPHGVKHFNKLLFDIYSDTPIIINISKRVEVVFGANIVGFDVRYKVINNE